MRLCERRVYSSGIFSVLQQNGLIPSATSEGVFYTSFGRTALYLLLSAIDCKNRDVLLPAFTCPRAVVMAVVKAGGNPVFVDVDPFLLNFDMGDLKKKISKRAVAMISHHYFGMVNREIEKNQEIAKEFNLIHIEDCCHSMGAKLSCRPVGSFSDASLYSFAKIFGTPGGGMLICHSKPLTEKVKKYLSSHCYVSRAHSIMKTFHFMNYGYTLWILNNVVKTKNRSWVRQLTKMSLPFFALTVCFAGFLGENVGKLKRINEFELSPSMTPFQSRLISFALNRGISLLQNRKRDALFGKIKSLPFVCDDFTDGYSFNDLYVVLRGGSDFIERLDRLAKSSSFVVSLPWIDEEHFRDEQYLNGVRSIKNHLRIIFVPLSYGKVDLVRVYNFLRECMDWKT